MNQSTAPADRIRRLPWVMDTCGLRRTSIWRYEKEGYFPKRVKLGSRNIGWRESEVLAWVASREAVGGA